MKTKNKIGTIALMAALVLGTAAGTASAVEPTFYNGCRGPTNFQLQSILKKVNNDVMVNPLFAKYWDDQKWALATVPYKIIDMPDNHKEGFGDLTFIAGPVFKAYNVNCKAYAGATFPTAEAPLGNERYDLKAGLLTTSFAKDKVLSLDTALEYTLTGENKDHVNPPDVLSGGAIFGCELKKGTKIGAGLDFVLNQEKDYTINPHFRFNHSFSKSFDFRAKAATNFKERNMPRNDVLTLMFGYNF